MDGKWPFVHSFACRCPFRRDTHVVFVRVVCEMATGDGLITRVGWGVTNRSVQSGNISLSVCTGIQTPQTIQAHSHTHSRPAPQNMSKKEPGYTDCSNACHHTRLHPLLISQSMSSKKSSLSSTQNDRRRRRDTWGRSID